MTTMADTTFVGYSGPCPRCRKAADHVRMSYPTYKTIVKIYVHWDAKRRDWVEHPITFRISEIKKPTV